MRHFLRLFILFFVFGIMVTCEKEKENLPPTCEITAPPFGTIFQRGETVTISVDAKDRDGSIKEVRFYIDGSSVWSANTFPYNYDWETKGYLYGNHIIKVVAIDDGNLEAQESLDINLEISELTDSRDNHVYKTVKIGEQWWMAENLAYLPKVSPPSGESYAEPYYYVYGYSGSDVAAAKATANYCMYGVLYNWPAAKAACCPVGWHLPSDDEWAALTTFLGGDRVAGGNMKEAGTAHWLSPNTGATNDGGFSSLPGGYRTIGGGFFYDGHGGYWWSATEYSPTYAWCRSLSYQNIFIGWGGINKEHGFSVRCVRD
ncbi:MAG: hypothetical protein HQ521_03260 [Bacteroidetes bacterium]|nr:hypothetical protein [Bacteroidota bacterium]